MGICGGLAIVYLLYDTFANGINIYKRFYFLEDQNTSNFRHGLYHRHNNSCDTMVDVDTTVNKRHTIFNPDHC